MANVKVQDIVVGYISYCCRGSVEPCELANPEKNQSLSQQLVASAIVESSGYSKSWDMMGDHQRNVCVKAMRRWLSDRFPGAIGTFAKQQQIAKLKAENAKLAELQQIPAQQTVAPMAIDFGDEETELDRARRELAEARVAHDLGKLDKPRLDKVQRAYTQALLNC